MIKHLGLKMALVFLTLLFCSGLALAGGKNETATTIWLVIINDPSACSGEPCSEADIFGTVPANPTKATVCYLTGQSVQANGRATFAGRFGEGTNHGCFFPGSDPAFGLMDADMAEIHAVVQEHGYALKSGSGLEDQVSYFEGNCTPACTDSQFTIHLPGSADGDGKSMTMMYRFADGSMLKGTTSTLTREDSGIRMVVHTRLE